MKLIINEDLICDGQTVVLGISGGPDSVCLLCELSSLSAARREAGGAGNTIICAHLNHGLRGGESDGDEEFVVDLSMKYGLAYEIKRIDAAMLAKSGGMSVEEVSRNARYEFFDDICMGAVKKAVYAGRTALYYETVEEAKEPVIAVAHNRDDQAETVLMRILRGTGTDGLAGMAQKRKSAAGYDIIRPLLGASREEIEKQLAVYGETARTDGSNLKTEYFRNRIRLEALPYLEENLNPGLRQSLLRLSENAAEDKDYFDVIVKETLKEYLDYSDEISTLPVEILTSIHPAIRHRLIRAVFAKLGLCHDIAAVHLAAAGRLLQTWKDGGEASGKRVEFPLDYTFGVAGKKAVFRTPAAADPIWKPRRRHVKKHCNS